ncbi:MAG: endonuclease III [Nitrospirae bacterium]|nr:endonuclease III [Nitrospirota bacterium]
MGPEDIHKVIRILRKQVKTLKVPYVDYVANLKKDPFHVLISCILSLRTQDSTTSGASERLFRLADTPERLCKLPVARIQKAIYPVGFYRVKAERIKEIACQIVKKYKGHVPDNIEELLRLKGVGRKTANLVVARGYNKPAICVDTHVHRITNRWGYVKTRTPEQTEFVLREKLPVKYWKDINGLLVAFGQGICRPISPICSKCLIYRYCDRVGVKKWR